MNKNDERIIKLKEQIKIKKEELSKSTTKRFNPETNCMLTLDGETYNIRVVDLTLVFLRLNALLMSAKDLKIDPNVIVISGFTLEQWVNDITQKLAVDNYKKEKTKLDNLEKQLSNLLSEDKQKELLLDDIEKLI